MYTTILVACISAIAAIGIYVVVTNLVTKNSIRKRREAALKEAEAHKGPSLVIAYAPCINHGIKAGMNNVQAEMKKAVDCGLWPLYRYDPNKTEKPFSLDYKKPSVPVEEFFNGEVRYAGLKIKYPETAAKLFAEAQVEADARYETYVALAHSYNKD